MIKVWGGGHVDDDLGGGRADKRRGDREEAAGAGGHGETETISESNEGSLSEFALGGREPTIAQAMFTIGGRLAAIHLLMDGFRHASVFDDSYRFVCSVKLPPITSTSDKYFV